ncbi:sensor histidine kinase [Paenibacillus sp. sgz302251]|uniref:sensor histidine kinase n=1 Tax=Paenibacillus sp. sgz302251 TaxID=3414493 RepID=UPI003C7E8407
MIRNRFVSLRSKIMVFSILLTVFPLLVVSSFSFVESTKLIRSQVIDLNLVSAKQISNNLEFIVNDVETVSLNLIQNSGLNAYLSSSNPAYKQNRQLQMLSLLNDQTFNKRYIYSIYIQDTTGTEIENRGALNTIDIDRVEQAKRLNGKPLWYFNSIMVGNKHLNVISMIREINDMNNIGRTLGYMKINVLESSISELYRTELKDKSAFYLIDEDQTILSTVSEDQAGGKLRQSFQYAKMASRQEGYFNTQIGERDYLAVFYHMDRQGWGIIELTPYELITKPGEVIKRVTIYSIIVSLIICLGFIMLFVSRVLQPLKQIRVLMKNVENENFNTEMKVQGNDEITLLARSFNKMSQKLDETINEVHVSKIKQKEAELKALEEQINPHFLYNTLDLIYWMSRMEKAFETSKMINALSRLFRIGLNSGSGFTTVAREVDHLQSYLVIQQKRYQETISFTFDVAPETLDCKVTKIILQPLVENAISHGIEQNGGSGRIDIRIYKEEDDLIYVISDDGAGADEQVILGLLNMIGEDNKGLGLKNINDRIKLNFGSRYGIEFHSSPEAGATVLVRQPFIKGMDPNV